MELRKKIPSQLKINQEFQLKLVILTAVFFVAYAVVSLLGVSFFIGKFSQMGTELGVPNQKLFESFMSQQEERLLIIQCSSLFILFVALSLGLVWLSNKVAGPLYRLNKHLELLSNPDEELTEIKFRPYDELKEVEASFNKFIKRFEK